jgi:hypothetical protein
MKKTLLLFISIIMFSMAPSETSKKESLEKESYLTLISGVNKIILDFRTNQKIDLKLINENQALYETITKTISDEQFLAKLKIASAELSLCGIGFAKCELDAYLIYYTTYCPLFQQPQRNGLSLNCAAKRNVKLSSDLNNCGILYCGGNGQNDDLIGGHIEDPGN